MNQSLVASDVLKPNTDFPLLLTSSSLREVLDQMQHHNIGLCCIVDSYDNPSLRAVFTDGDLRRLILTHQSPLAALFNMDIIDLAITQPITIPPDLSLSAAVQLMDSKQVWDLPVVNNGILVGLLHLHPAIERLLGTANV